MAPRCLNERKRQSRHSGRCWLSNSSALPRGHGFLSQRHIVFFFTWSRRQRKMKSFEWSECSRAREENVLHMLVSKVDVWERGRRERSSVTSRQKYRSRVRPHCSKHLLCSLRCDRTCLGWLLVTSCAQPLIGGDFLSSLMFSRCVSCSVLSIWQVTWETLVLKEIINYLQMQR